MRNGGRLLSGNKRPSMAWIISLLPHRRLNRRHHKMKLLVGILCVAISHGLSINSRSSSGGGACGNSPCGQGAICEVREGLTVCRCPEGMRGDPFSMCVSSGPATEVHMTSGNDMMTSTNKYAPTNMDIIVPSTHYIVQTTETLANGGGYEVDFSRVPMRGETTPTQRPGQFGINEGVTVEQTSGSVFLTPQRRPNEQQQQQQSVVSHGGNRIHSSTSGMISGSSGSSSFHLPQGQGHFIPTEDPLGVFQRCRSINGIVVCADNSDNNLGQANLNIPFKHRDEQAPPPQNWMESQMFPSRDQQSSSRPTLINSPQTGVPVSSSSSSDLCKSMCGVNSVCRLVLGRPVCGCPQGTTGDPSVRCESMKDGGLNMGASMSSNSRGMCQRHTECGETEICVRGQCSDPCKSTMDAGGMCGANSKCVVVQHTPLCGCNEGFTGNPYERCLSIVQHQ